ncbi:MAG: hypothetical protein HKN29_07320 [Rhodothermales bacterium]|nr:hypothetical protein [Rhodothermales bacterium]
MTADKLTMLAERLADTLAQEAGALGKVRDALAGMLAAVRSADGEQLRLEAERMQELVHSATELRHAHTRQIELFFRLVQRNGNTIDDILDVLTSASCAPDIKQRLASERQTIRDIAIESGRLVASTEYALRCAGQINHELILMLHSVMQPDGGRVYTSNGGTEAPSNRRSMIDRMG